MRLIYEKRNGACFVPHVALATVFTRAAARAGLRLRLTEGFSPHARMSFGPELPAGVVALREPVDIWVEEVPAGQDPVHALDMQMPDGFRIRKCVPVADDAPALGRECKAAHYLTWPRNEEAVEEYLAHLKKHYDGSILDIFVDESEKISRISFVLADPAENGIGGWVRALVASGIATGWQDLCIVRTTLGRWNGTQMESLAEEGIVCLQAEK